MHIVLSVILYKRFYFLSSQTQNVLLLINIYEICPAVSSREHHLVNK